MVAKPSGHKNKHVLGIAQGCFLAIISATRQRQPVVFHERKSVKCTRSLFDTVYPIPAGFSLASGSSGRQSYWAKTYHLSSSPSPQVNVAKDHWTENPPSGLSPLHTAKRKSVIFRRPLSAQKGQKISSELDLEIR